MLIKDQFAGQKVLITGGLGFIGSNLAHRLINLGAEVTLFDSCDPNSSANTQNIKEIQDKVHFIEADIRDQQILERLVEGKALLFNLAAQSSHIGSMQDPINDLEINAIGHLKLLETCKKYNQKIRIIYTSTRQIYGRPQYMPVDEAHPIAPVDFNGISKLTGTFYHLAFHNTHDLWTVVLRLTNVFGPRMRVKDAHLNFIGNWFAKLIQGKEIEIYGDGKQIRDLNYVDDVVDALLLSALNPTANGKIYNLGADPTNLLDLARLMIQLNGSGKFKLVPFPEDRKRIDIGDYFGNYSRIQNELGWQPKISLKQGLEKTFEFYRKRLADYL